MQFVCINVMVSVFITDVYHLTVLVIVLIFPDSVPHITVGMDISMEVQWEVCGWLYEESEMDL